MRPISNDLRLRIIEAIQANEDSQPEIAERFAVSLSFVEKLWHRFRVSGSYEPMPHAGGRARLLKDDEQLIRAEIAARADQTLAELCETIGAQTGKAEVSLMTMSAELRRLRLPRKKS